MAGDESAIPLSIMANDVRRIADALEALVEFKRKALSGELTPHWAKPKTADKWLACRRELLRLLDEFPYLDWPRARANPIFRDPGIGNIYREHQWRRFLNQPAIPNKPDDFSKGHIVALG